MLLGEIQGAGFFDPAMKNRRGRELGGGVNRMRRLDRLEHHYTAQNGLFPLIFRGFLLVSQGSIFVVARPGPEKHATRRLA
jgi:hypothetical protein